MKTKHTVAVAILTAMLGTGCKESSGETFKSDSPYGEQNTVAADSVKPANGGTHGESHNASQSNATTGDTQASADGSSGSTVSTAVNKAKAIQVKNRSNASGGEGYSAPDGTPAENRDGDMYTKHDTTRMPSGSTPIK